MLAYTSGPGEIGLQLLSLIPIHCQTKETKACMFTAAFHYAYPPTWESFHYAALLLRELLYTQDYLVVY